MNLVLIGYRGTGKSTLARAVAGELGWDWVDTDEEIERRTGSTIRTIFEEQGEAGFRDVETAVLGAVLARDRQVVATGGGVVIRPQNRQVLRQAGAVVWLRAEPATIVQRISVDPASADRRPNLTAAGGLSEVQRLLAERTPWYRECADLEVITDGKSIRDLAREVLDWLRRTQPALEGP